MQNKSKLKAKSIRAKNGELSNSLGAKIKPSSRSNISPKSVTTVRLELRKQKTKEAFALARLTIYCAVIVSLTIVIVSKDTNLFLEILKLFGVGGAGYGIARYFPR